MQDCETFEEAAAQAMAPSTALRITGWSMTARQKTFAMEDIMRAMPQVDVPVKHHYGKGLYGREIAIPAGTTLTGRIHKFANLNVLLSGQMSVSMDDGEQHLVTGPCVVVSPAGTKRIAHTVTDCVWLTFLGTDATDPEAIELEFTAADEQDYLTHCEQLQIKGA